MSARDGTMGQVHEGGTEMAIHWYTYEWVYCTHVVFAASVAAAVAADCAAPADSSDLNVWVTGEPLEEMCLCVCERVPQDNK